MFQKNITFVVIPQKNSEVRRIQVPTFWLTLGLLLTLCGIFLWFWVVTDYFQLKGKLESMQGTRHQYIQLNKELKTFSTQEGKVLQDFAYLANLNQQLRYLANIETKAKAQASPTSNAGKKKEEEMLAQVKTKGILSIITSNKEQLDSEANAKVIRSRKLLAFYQRKQNPLRQIPEGWPVKGLVIRQFGLNTDVFTGQVRSHNGITIASRSLTPVLAPADGIIEFAGPDSGLHNVVSINHGNGIITRYGYISNLEVQKGKLVKRGETIAQVVNTGLTSGTQLYYEVLVNHIPQNPIKYIKEAKN